jgi:hypothetical protein
MRSRHALPLALLALSMPGCLIDRSAIGGDDAGGGGIDAYLDPSVDASLDAARPPDTNTDAWLDPSLDAWAPDAFVPPPDAWAPDAWTPDAFGADAWAPDAWAPDAFSCMPRCEGNVLVACDGSRTTCVACGTSDAVAEPHCLELVPSNTGSVDLTGRADEVNLTSVVTWDTSTCNSGGLSGVAREIGHEVTVEGVDLCVVLTNRFTLSGELRVVGDRSLVIVARDRIDITASGVLTVASLNDESTGTCGRDVIGAGAQPMSAAQAGQNGVAGSTGSFNPDSGGGGGGRCGGGGRGGDGLGADGLGDAAGGDGGSGAAVDDLVPLVGGTPGGNGFGRVGEGGAGGGAVQLSAPRVSVLGQILAHGAGGLGGGLENAGRRRGAGGGGGSGGAIHLEALELTLGGASMLDVRGGGGGAPGCWNGSEGVVGHCAISTAAPETTDGSDEACGGTARGGTGGSGASADGTEGDAFADGAGGGGGAGCVLLRSRIGSPAAAVAPSAASVLGRMAPTVR